MNNSKEIKEIVKEKYSEIAKKSMWTQSSCCGPDTSCCGEEEVSIMGDEYTELQGYNPDADLGLGCGIPTEFAGIQTGHTVVDLGSGAGNDVFVARSFVGDTGKVIGVDFTKDMIQKAELNNSKLGYENVEFKFGDIENLPLEDDAADVVISNCVMNLVPDKDKAYAEVYRTLKPGGHFCISDIVLNGELPDVLRKSAEMYAGCVSGAMQEEEYLAVIERAGFSGVEIKSVKEIVLPEYLIRDFLSSEEYESYKSSGIGIKSITVVGRKV
jgi:ubiquinone/menaquinone biosynthesis C-methylase UbiE